MKKVLWPPTRIVTWPFHHNFMYMTMRQQKMILRPFHYWIMYIMSWQSRAKPEYPEKTSYCHRGIDTLAGQATLHKMKMFGHLVNLYMKESTFSKRIKFFPFIVDPLFQGKIKRLWIQSRQAQSVVSLSKTLYPHCLVLASPQEERWPHGRSGLVY